MSAGGVRALFACSRCFSGHPFEDLSPGQQLCKECGGAFPVVGCACCGSEFQQAMKGGTGTICGGCERNVGSCGGPSACECCSAVAAFIGGKCQRCAGSEGRCGPPVACERCGRGCAFDGRDEDERVDGRLLCWLCALSCRRALAGTGQSDAGRRARVRVAQQRAAKHREQKLKGHNKRPHRVDVTRLPPRSEGGDASGPAPMRAARVAGVRDPRDPDGSDHVVAVAQLREAMASLQKRIDVGESQLLAKDRQITELRARGFTSETELRGGMEASEKEYETGISSMQRRMSGLLREVATLSGSSKRADGVAAAGTEAGTSSGGGAGSPVL